MTRSNAIPMVLFIAIVFSVVMNPPEANEVAPHASARQIGNSTTDSGIAVIDSKTVAYSYINASPITLREQLAGVPASTLNVHSPEFVNTKQFSPQAVFGKDSTPGSGLLPTGASDAGVLSSDAFALSAIYGARGSVVAQK